MAEEGHERGAQDIGEPNRLAARAGCPRGRALPEQRRDLGLRLPWLFGKGLLPEALKELSTCIKEDGNDGAHAGTLQKTDAEDLLDFTTALLQRFHAGVPSEKKAA